MESMRQLKFKGKSIDAKKWVYGSLVKTPFGTFIEWYEDSICNKVEVDPSTVCQYTELTDFFGKELYEHDIIKNYPFRPVEIVWKESEGGFYLRYLNGKFESNTFGYYLSLGKYKFLRSKFDKEV